MTLAAQPDAGSLDAAIVATLQTVTCERGMPSRFARYKGSARW